MNFGRSDYNDFLSRASFKDERDRLEVESDEPVFLIRGSDPIAPRLLMMYATELMSTSTDRKIIDSVIDHADRFRKYQKDHGTKSVDLIREDASSLADKIEITNILNNIELGNANADSVMRLHELMDQIYGPTSVCVLLPSDIESSDTPIRYKCRDNRKKEFDNAQVAYAYLHTGSIILMKRSKGL